MATSSKLLLISATIALTACANSGRNSSADAGGNHTSATTATNSSSACRSIGEGRRINNRGQNGGYVCKANTVLNSEEAKSALDPNIRVPCGNASGMTLTSRQVANAVGKSPDGVCQRTFLSVVRRFQSTAQRRNKRAAQVVSYFDKRTVGGSEYEYHIGTWNSHVVLEGSANQICPDIKTKPSDTYLPMVLFQLFFAFILMADRILCYLLGDPLLATSCHNNSLNLHDRHRIGHTPQLAERTDWKVSCASKQLTDSSVVSLSHSEGLAALLRTDYPIPAGADLEAVRPRDLRSLLKWVCTAKEQEYPYRHNWQAEMFYRLWCTKEALLKAAGLNFPADMASVGYQSYGNEVSGLRVPHQNGWHGITARLTPNFTLACVWRGEGVRIDQLFYDDLNVDNLSKLEAV